MPKIRAYADELGVEVEIFDSNFEGEVINRLYEAHDEDIAGAIIDPGGLYTGLSGPGRGDRQRPVSDDQVHIANPVRAAPCSRR